MPLKEKKSFDIGKNFLCVHVQCRVKYMYLLAIKKLKHKMVEKLDEETADSLGISRAILIHGK